MENIKLEPSILHEMPIDMENAILNDDSLVEKWNSLTKIQRNEWICWTISVKKDETRKKHIIRMIDNLNRGKRTPCCWPGCSHRKQIKIRQTI